VADERLPDEPPVVGLLAEERRAVGLLAEERLADERLADVRLVADRLADAERPDAVADPARVRGRWLVAGLLADAERLEAERRADGFVAAGRLAVLPPLGLTSSSDTRLARPSMSERRPLSSPSTRSSSTSRMRFAAPATSFARPRVDWAPSAVAAKVRSTADRTASTASTAPAAALSLFPFLSFFAMTARS
jgi:hypothetical protein